MTATRAQAAATGAPFFAALADGPPGGQAAWVRAADGMRLRLVHWPGGDRGTVLLLPGRTEYAEKYGRAAADLARRGFATLVIDWRGQGLSDRHPNRAGRIDPMLGHVGHFDEYQRDLDAMLAHADHLGLPGPRFMIAHSMGGAIGLRGLMRGLPIRAVAFSAPMWGIHLSPMMRPVAHILGALAGPFGQSFRYAPGTGPVSYAQTAPFAGNVLTTDPAMWDYMAAQMRAEPDLRLGGPSFGWVNAALRECAALSNLPAPDLPAFTALGSAEKVVATMPIHLRMVGWKGGRLDLYQGAEHEVMMETPAHRARFFDSAAALFT